MTTDETLSEAEIKYAIRAELPKLGVVLFNNASGVAENHGRRIRYGLARGSSDLIGFTPRNGVAVFTVIEAKDERGMHAHNLALIRAHRKIAGKQPLTKQERRAYEQQLFIDLVRKKGGLSGFATSVEDAIEIVTRP